jgi:D-amino peptidase
MTQCAPLFTGVEQAVVKYALGHRAAWAFSPQTACQTIHDAAMRAMGNLAAMQPFTVAPPYRLEIDLTTVAITDQAAIIPVAERVGARCVAFAANTMPEVIGWVNTVSALSSALR